MNENQIFPVAESLLIICIIHSHMIVITLQSLFENAFLQ